MSRGDWAGRNDEQLVRVVIRLPVVFRIGDNNHFSQDGIKRVTAVLFITSPLDDHIEADFLDGLPGMLPGSLFQKSVITRVSMSNVRQDGKLHSSGERDVLT